MVQSNLMSSAWLQKIMAFRAYALSFHVHCHTLIKFLLVSNLIKRSPCTLTNVTHLFITHVYDGITQGVNEGNITNQSIKIK